MSDTLTATRGESELTDADKVALAVDNHIWINAFECIRPSDELLRSIGRIVVDKLNESRIHGDFLGVSIGKVLYVRVNKS